MNVNDSNNTSRTDWAALEAMIDEEIDYSDKQFGKINYSVGGAENPAVQGKQM